MSVPALWLDILANTHEYFTLPPNVSDRVRISRIRAAITSCPQMFYLFLKGLEYAFILETIVPAVGLLSSK